MGRRGRAGRRDTVRAMTAVLVLLAAASGAAAQVNRCTGGDHRVRYTDRSCETLGLVRDAEGSARLAGVALDTYDVSGTDGAALQAALADAGPGGFHARAEWDVRYAVRVAPTPEGRCRVTGVRTTLTGRLRVPRWTDEARAPAPLRAAWTRYLDALMTHEEGHIATGQSLVQALSAEIGAATGPDCKTLRASVDRTAQRLIDAHQSRDRDYDTETQHGAAQGARLVLP